MCSIDHNVTADIQNVQYASKKIMFRNYKTIIEQCIHNILAAFNINDCKHVVELLITTLAQTIFGFVIFWLLLS